MIEARKWEPADKAASTTSLIWWAHVRGAKSFHRGVIEGHYIMTSCGRWLERTKTEVLPERFGRKEWTALPTFCQRCGKH